MTGDPCKQRFSCNRVLSFSMTGADTQERSGDEAKSTFIKSCVLKEKDCTSEAKNVRSSLAKECFCWIAGSSWTT